MSRLFVFFAVIAALPATAQLSVAYNQKSLAISGASPAADIAVYGVIHRHVERLEVIHPQSSIVHGDSTGRATVAVDDFSSTSIWLIVDLRSGDYLVSAPPGFIAHRLPIPTDALEPAGRSVSSIRSMLDVFVARRGVGAWHAHVTDSGASDRDARLGHVTFDIQPMTPVGATPPGPPHLIPGDIVMVVDVAWFQFWAGQLTPAHLPGVNDAH